MTLDKSLKVKRGATRNRSVMTRVERIQRLKEADRWSEGDSPLGLPKVRVRKMTMKKNAKRLPTFKSLEEEPEYWDKHSLTEHLGEFKAVKLKLKGPVKHLLSIRIDLDLVRKIRRIADHRGVPYQTLMQQWLLERAEEEAPTIQPGSVYASGFAIGTVRDR